MPWWRVVAIVVGAPVLALVSFRKLAPDDRYGEERVLDFAVLTIMWACVLVALAPE